MSNAIILAGGDATRLRPLTDEVPKALVPLGPTCLLELQLLWLRQAGVSVITIAARAAQTAIAARYGDGERLGVHLDYLPESEPLGSGGVLRAAAAHWDEPFWVLNGDVLIDLPLTAMAERHAETGAWGSIALAEVKDVQGFGVVELGGDDEIHRFVEKPDPADAPSPYVNAGVWRFAPEAIALLPKRGFVSVEYTLFPAILDAGHRLQGFRAGPYWVDVGTPERCLQAALDLAQGRLPSVPGWPQIEGGTFIDPTAQIAPDATIEAPCLIGPHSRVEARARIVGSVLWEGVRVGANSEIEASIIADAVSIAPGLHIQQAVIGRRANVTRAPAPGARLATDADQ